MPTVTLDVNTVRNATCPADREKLDLYDTATPGFVLEVRGSGGKTYYLRYRDAHGKQRQHRIGDASGISFEQAKNAAQTVRAKVILGDNPAENKKLLRTIPTLEDFAHSRYLPYVKGAKRSWDTDESFLRNHVLPRWGKCHLDEIKQQDVIEFHHALKAKGYAPATAHRVVILSRYMFNLAKKWKIPGAEHNPASGVELFEENNKRERFLNAEGQLSGEFGAVAVRGAEDSRAHALKTTQRYAHLSQVTLLEAVDSLAGVSGLSLAVA